MSHDTMSAACARHYQTGVDMKTQQPRLLALAEQAATAAFTVPHMTEALAKGLDEAAALMRAVPIQEGGLLEQGIVLLAGANPDLVVLTENIRLPVTPAALELVSLNEEQLYRRLTLDADTGGRKGYTPDMLLIHRSRKLTYLVDVKRSLASYESTRIAELKSRMLASSLVVPDLLYKAHRRISVEEVRAVIIDAGGQKVDIEHGVWPLGHVDHLLEIDGAGLAMEWLRGQFAAAVERNWKAAVRELAAANRPRLQLQRIVGKTGVATVLSGAAFVGADDEDGFGAVHDAMASGAPKPVSERASSTTETLQPPLRIGFARAPV